MYKFIKRFFDFSLSLLAIIILSPVFFIVGILVALFIGFPVIFKQPRPGKDGKLFMLCKFRSMTNKKDKNGDLLPDSQRITKFGKFLRVSSLDELPQLFNILKGDMSIIGPRPRIVQEIVFLKDEQLDRQKVCPGITGLAQINGRNNITFDTVCEFDRKYIERMNFWFDFKIFFKTIAKVFIKEGINKEGTVSNEFYGDYLLRMGRISQEEYNQKITQARRIEFAFKQARTTIAEPSFEAQEDFDWEHKHTD